MARGWESKSVEAQQEDATRTEARGAPVGPDEVVRRQEIKSLLLSRARAGADRHAASQPARRAALDAALRDLDARLAALGHVAPE